MSESPTVTEDQTPTEDEVGNSLHKRVAQGGGPTSHSSQPISRSSFKPVSFKPSTFHDSLMPSTVRCHLSSASIRSEARAAIRGEAHASAVRGSPKPTCSEYGKPADGGSRAFGFIGGI